MDHQAGALAKSIKSMKVMLAEARCRRYRRPRTRTVQLVVGGYGLFGVIVEAELDIADNLVYQTGRRMMDYKEFPALFAKEIEKDGNIGLMYGHLSTAPSSFLRELLLYTYTKVDGTDFKREPLGEVSGTKLRRLTINLSKQGALFQEMKWLSEKHIEHRMETCTVTRRRRSDRRRPVSSTATTRCTIPCLTCATRCPTTPTSCTNISSRAASSFRSSMVCARC
jgi:FAD/FMN-containing dehydrogenase